MYGLPLSIEVVCRTGFLRDEVSGVVSGIMAKSLHRLRETGSMHPSRIFSLTLVMQF